MAPSYLEVEDGSWLQASEIVHSFCVPMAVRAAINLDVFETLSAHHGSLLSAQDIIAHLKASHTVSNPSAHIALDRVLRVLVSYGYLTSSLRHDQPADARHVPVVRAYALTPVGRYFASGPNASLRPLHLLGQSQPYLDTWQFLEQAILEGGDPFTLAHGQNAFLYGNVTNRAFGSLFNMAMTSQTKLFVPFFLQAYEGLAGVKTLVDVAGGTGIFISSIVAKHPHIKGINFDQPHVVAHAPSYPGVQHVGGDIFESIPKADVIIMKSILHDWHDEACVKILQNCYKALPSDGKVIVVDTVVSEGSDTSERNRISVNFDLIMLAFCPGGKERTEKELRSIASTAGFPTMKLVCQVNEFVVSELHKI